MDNLLLEMLLEMLLDNLAWFVIAGVGIGAFVYYVMTNGGSRGPYAYDDDYEEDYKYDDPYMEMGYSMGFYAQIKGGDD